MPKNNVKIKDDNRLPDLIKICEELASTEIHIGIFGADDSTLLMIANVNEFGVTIKPKKAKRLAVPINPKTKGKSPREFNDLFPIRSEQGTLFLVRNKGANELEFMYWLATEVRIPERAFIRGGFDANHGQFSKMASRQLKKVFAGELSIDSFFSFMGDYIVGGLKRYMTSLRDPPNSWASRSAKGRDNPLIDSGRLRDAITFKVVKV